MKTSAVIMANDGMNDFIGCVHGTTYQAIPPYQCAQIKIDYHCYASPIPILQKITEWSFNNWTEFG
jgi:hypothetical protein